MLLTCKSDIEWQSISILKKAEVELKKICEEDIRNTKWDAPILIKIDGISAVAASAAKAIAESLTKLELFVFSKFSEMHENDEREKLT